MSFLSGARTRLLPIHIGGVAGTVLVFFQKPIRSWKLITDVAHLLFSHMLLFQLTFILRPFARSGLSPLLVMAVHGSHHVDLECKILAPGSCTETT